MNVARVLRGGGSPNVPGLIQEILVASPRFRPHDFDHRPPRSLVRRLVVTGALVLAIVAAPRAQSVMITPPAPITPTTTLTTINAGAGAQVDRHISADGNLASYTSTVSGVSQIRYFNFATNADFGIPTARKDTAITRATAASRGTTGTMRETAAAGGRPTASITTPTATSSATSVT